LRTFRAKCRLTGSCHVTFPNTFPSERTHALYAVSAGVRSTRNEDGGIVLDIDHGQMFRLNPVGALILESLGKGCAETEIAKEISHQYSISEETAIADVRQFLKSLEEHRLIHMYQAESRCSCR
jgi:Coenzyme PQQ synthesis protein D (PqqD)